MDRFGSNATPMGGSAGRVDAAIGAIEAQKAEGVLHLHAFIFLQAAHQFNTLHEIGEMLRKSLITVDMMKAYTSNVRRASYPDAAQFQQEKAYIEKPGLNTSMKLPCASRLRIYVHLTGSAQ